MVGSQFHLPSVRKVNNLANTPITFWLLFLLGLLTLLTASMTVNTWRKTKQNFHLFNRREAEISMQNYLTVTLVLGMFLLLVGGYLWLEGSILRGQSAEAAPLDDTVTVVAFNQLSTLTPTLPPTPTRRPVGTPTPRPTSTSSAGRTITDTHLPIDYANITPQSPLREDSHITSLVFASRISQEYRPLDPGRRFSLAIETLYATFEYRNMEDGFAWSWVWRKDGEVIDGGNQRWVYSTVGPAFISTTPEDGFEAGEYSAEVWFNGELFERASVTIIDPNALTLAEAPNNTVLLLTTPEVSNAPRTTLRPDLPERYDQIEPETDRPLDSRMEISSFSAERGNIDQPLTLSATLNPENLPAGVVLTWLWQRGDLILGGGNQLWTGEDDSLGLVHLVSADAIQPGNIALEVWVNRERMARASVIVSFSEESD